MTLGAHLTELRRRVVRIAAALLVGSVGGWFLSGYVLEQMRAPIVAVVSQQHRLADLNYDNITSAFDLRIQIAITIGAVVSSPIWLYQIWAFLVPALTRRELKYALSFFFSAVPLFLIGCTAGWILVPHMVALMTSFAPGGSTSFIQATTYFSFILKLVIAVGVAFVLPVFLVLLNYVGVLSAHAIVKSWRIALLAILVFTGIVTPSADLISMFVLALPIIGLYLAAGAIAVVHDRRKERTEKQLFATEFAA
jgi:sec-independent protein translocase protein TatC